MAPFEARLAALKSFMVMQRELNDRFARRIDMLSSAVDAMGIFVSRANRHNRTMSALHVFSEHTLNNRKPEHVRGLYNLLWTSKGFVGDMPPEISGGIANGVSPISLIDDEYVARSTRLPLVDTDTKRRAWLSMQKDGPFRRGVVATLGCGDLDLLEDAHDVLGRLVHLTINSCSKPPPYPENFYAIPRDRVEAMQRLTRLELEGTFDLTGLFGALPSLVGLSHVQMYVDQHRSMDEIPGNGTLHVRELELGPCDKYAVYRIPGFLRGMTSLRDLVLRDYLADGLDDSIAGLELHCLQLRGLSGLETLGDRVTGMTTLRSLKVALDAPGFFVPESITRLTDLTSFEVEVCYPEGFTAFPRCVLGLSSLVSLEVMGSSEHGPTNDIPDDFGRLVMLTHLRVMGFTNGELPPSMGGLSSLKTLQVCDFWRLSRLGECVGMLGCLEDVTIKDCPVLREIPPNAFSRSTSLKSVYLSGLHQMDVLPTSLYSLASLDTLFVTSCGYASIDERLAGMSSLRSLTVSQPKPLPSCLPAMRITSLIISLWESMSFTHVYEMFSLKILELRGESPVGGEDVLGGMSCLEELHIHSRKPMAALPVSIADLSKLRMLTVRNPSAALYIPKSFTGMSALVDVNIPHDGPMDRAPPGEMSVPEFKKWLSERRGQDSNLRGNTQRVSSPPP